MMAEQPKTTGGEHGGKAPLDGLRNNPSNPTRTLKELGIDDKHLADRAGPSAAPWCAFPARALRTGRGERMGGHGRGGA